MMPTPLLNLRWPVALLAPIFLITVPAAVAQSNQLDDARFIQGLRERGMNELVLYFIERHPPDDPVVKQELMVEQHKLRFDEESLEPAARAAAADDALAAYRNLLEQSEPDHPKRPIWRTEFVSYIARVALPLRHVNAAQFVEFGLPTGEQRAAFERLVGQALEAMEHADEEMFSLLGDLPRRDDFEQRFVNTGLWMELRDDYGAVRLPYYRAWAHYHAALLREPAGDLGEARRLLERVLREDLSDAAEPEARVLLGRVLLALGEPEAALDQFDRVIGHGSASDQQVFEAHLARSRALHESDREAAALDAVAQARRHRFARANPMLLLLTHDREFLITGDHEVFDRLLDDPAIGEVRDQVRAMVNRRLAVETMDEAQLDGAAPIQVLATVDQLIERGRDARSNAERAAEVGDPTLHDDQEEEAEDRFRRAIGLLDTLLDRDGLSEEARGQALFKRGIAEHHRGRPYFAARSWVELADSLPDQPVAQSAAINSLLILRDLYNRHGDSRQVVELFDRAQRVLLDKYPSAPMPGGQTARAHWHTRGSFLRQEGRYEEAVEAFDRVGSDHPLRADALYQRMICRYELMREADARERAAAAEPLLIAAERALDALRSSREGAAGDRARTLLRQEGDTLLRLAETHAEVIGETDPARELLDGYDERFREFPGLVTAKRQLMIAIHVQDDEIEAARDEVRRLVRQSPGEGGAMIRSVLDAINRQIDDRKALGEPWANEARLGVELATTLRDWAAGQPTYASDPARLLPFELVLGEQLVVAERHDAAAEHFEEIASRPGGEENLDVLYGRARALVAAEDHERALPLINRIIRLAPDQADPIVWDVWLMRFRILDARQGRARAAGEAEAAADVSRQIYTSILRLERFDADLGGARFRDELTRLRLKHAPR